MATIGRMHFEHLQPGLNAPIHAPHLDDDDDDECECEGRNAKQPGTIGALIQRKFLEQRKIFLWGAVTDESAKDITEKLLYLETVSPGKDITFYINTPGGSITAGMAVYDTMQLVSSPITVVVTGMAASMGSILLSGARKGRRFVYPHARVLIHQPLITGRMIGPAADINIQAREMEKLREELNQILANASGQPLEKIMKDTDRDFYLNAQESIEYGLADRVVDKI
jgi:ATP-dependent Clp protease protease subunit